MKKIVISIWALFGFVSAKAQENSNTAPSKN